MRSDIRHAFVKDADFVKHARKLIKVCIFYKRMSYVKDADFVKHARKLIKVKMLQSDDKHAQEAKQ